MKTASQATATTTGSGGGGLLDAALQPVVLSLGLEEGVGNNNEDDEGLDRDDEDQGDERSSLLPFGLRRRSLALLLPLCLHVFLLVWASVLPAVFKARVVAVCLPLVFDSAFTSPSSTSTTAAILNSLNNNDNALSAYSGGDGEGGSGGFGRAGNTNVVVDHFVHQHHRHPYYGQVAVVAGGCSLGDSLGDSSNGVVGFEMAASLAGQVGMKVVCAQTEAATKGKQAAEAIAVRYPEAPEVNWLNDRKGGGVHRITERETVVVPAMLICNLLDKLIFYVSSARAYIHCVDLKIGRR